MFLFIDLQILVIFETFYEFYDNLVVIILHYK